MNKIALMIAGLGIAASAIPMSASAAPAPGFASAQGWQTINARQARLNARIDQGVRARTLSRAEATRLRNDFRALARLEANYRRSRPGLTVAERRDLDRRFDALSARIRIEKNDRNGRRW